MDAACAEGGKRFSSMSIAGNGVIMIVILINIIPWHPCRPERFFPAGRIF
jgi:hypothetical protein